MERKPKTDKRNAKSNYIRRRILGAVAGVGATAFLVPTAAANEEDEYNQNEDDDLPDWISETPENEVELIAAERTDQPSEEGDDVGTQVADPEWQAGFDFEFAGRDFEATLSIYDMEDPICNYGVTISTGIWSSSGDRTDCEGSNSIGIDLVVADAEVGIEPLTGTVFDEGARLTGDVCVGEGPVEECGSIGFEFEF